MSRPDPTHRPRRLAAALASACTLVLGLPAAHALASASATTGVSIPSDAQHVTEVTTFLAAPHPRALAALAAAHGLTRAQRLQRLETLVPSTATHAAVARELRTLGLTVRSQTAWSLTSTGSTTAIASAFGTRPQLSRTASFGAATAALPSLPAALTGLVSVVFPTTAGPAVVHPMTTSVLDGTDFRNADTPANVTPSTGLNDKGTTIATVQFADFNANGVSNSAASDTAADLVSYAKEHSLPNPVATGQYKAVHVDGGPSQTDDEMGGDVEVDLDQESILSTAPSADQHPYFAPNTDAGFGDVFSAVYDDVVGNSMATAKDPNITALSSSWGECEGDTGAAAINAVEPALESLAAAGVTVFSASGDDGIYDCRSQTGTGADNKQADVDFPGSSPYVISVGGTNLSAATSAPNTGSNWTEKAWSCTDAMSCQATNVPTVGTGGGGGGASGSAYGTSTTATFKGFAAPEYQTATIKDAPFAGAKTRLVPDIAADGDPDTGFEVYTSNPQYVVEGGGMNDLQVGGTSLATPISAAQFDNALADAGIKTGVGDLHDALYSAYADTHSQSATDKTTVFRDVTSGTNGADADKGTDPSVSAQPGYDTVSGLGGVLWSALVPYLSVAPSGTLTEPNALQPNGTDTVDGTWTLGPNGNTGIAATAISVKATYGQVVYSTTSTGSSGTFSFTGKPGRTYTLSVTPTSLAGQSTTGTAKLVVPIDDRQFTSFAGWSHPAYYGTDFGGSHLKGSATSLSAVVTATGRSYAVRIIRGPSTGILGVYLGGKLIAKVDGYLAATHHKLVTVYTSSSVASRTFTLRPLGTKNAKSRGTAVAIDDVVVTY